MKTAVAFIVTVLLAANSSSVLADDALVVHEWGTLTTRHGPDGNAQGGLNRTPPSEVLPIFVHKYEPEPTAGNPQQQCSKSPLVPGRPDVTMRLETPVIYFHLPAESKLTKYFDVSVRFRGGILNEFYPQGQAAVALDTERITSKMQAGVIPARWDGNVLNNFVVGSLVWKGIRLVESAPLPQTEMNAWLAPRKVNSQSVLAPSGETEKYLFYRGVANLEALVQTRLSATDVVISHPMHFHWLTTPAMTISKLWLVDIREDLAMAFLKRRNIIVSKSNASKEIFHLPLFDKGEYSSGNLKELRASMRQELISSGLFEDEAEAMLETWKDSYYSSPGLRIFYMVPKEWTDYFLPLKISIPHELKRALVGRIDLLRR